MASKRLFVAVLLAILSLPVIELGVIVGSKVGRTVLEDSCVVVLSLDGSHGSGFIVDANSIITARHVVDCNSLSVVLTPDEEVYRVIRVQRSSADAARLYVDRPFTTKPARLASCEVHLRDAVEIVGTPCDLRHFNAVMPGVVVKLDVDTRTEYSSAHIHFVDAHVSAGVSGAPVFHQGLVVGITVLTNGYWTGFIPLAEFQDIL